LLTFFLNSFKEPYLSYGTLSLFST